MTRTSATTMSTTRFHTSEHNQTMDHTKSVYLSPMLEWCDRLLRYVNDITIQLFHLGIFLGSSTLIYDVVYLLSSLKSMPFERCSHLFATYLRRLFLTGSACTPYILGVSILRDRSIKHPEISSPNLGLSPQAYTKLGSSA